MDLFRNMFPDSEISQKMTGGEKKFAYIATFDLGPHFLDLLKEKAKSLHGFVLLFDELLNDSLQKKQSVIQILLAVIRKIIEKSPLLGAYILH